MLTHVCDKSDEKLNKTTKRKIISEKSRGKLQFSSLFNDTSPHFVYVT